MAGTAVQRTGSGSLCVLNIKTTHRAELIGGDRDVKSSALCKRLSVVAVRQSCGWPSIPSHPRALSLVDMLESLIVNLATSVWVIQ